LVVPKGPSSDFGSSFGFSSTTPSSGFGSSFGFSSTPSAGLRVLLPLVLLLLLVYHPSELQQHRVLVLLLGDTFKVHDPWNPSSILYINPQSPYEGGFSVLGKEGHGVYTYSSGDRFEGNFQPI